MRLPKFVKSKTFIYTSLGLLVLIIILVIVKKIISAPVDDDVTKQLKKQATGTTGSGSSTPKTSWENIAVFPLKLGSKNYFVGEVQKALNNYHKAGIKVDNDFGPVTNAAVVKYLSTPEITTTQYDAFAAKYKMLPRVSVMEQYKAEQEQKATAQQSIWNKLISFSSI